MFGPSECLMNITLDIDLQSVLNDLDRELLDRNFTLEEIRVALFSMKHNKAPSQDGPPAEFYQNLVGAGTYQGVLFQDFL